MDLYYPSRFLYRCSRSLLPASKKQVRGGGYVPQRGGCIIVVDNHTSSADPWRVADVIGRYRNDPIRWWTKKEFWDLEATYWDYLADYRKAGIFAPFLAYAVAQVATRLVQYSLTIPIDRDGKNVSANLGSIRESKQILAAGGMVGIFPQGAWNSPDWKPMFVWLAKTCDVPVLPMRIEEDRVVIRSPIPPSSVIMQQEREAAALAIRKIING